MGLGILVFSSFLLFRMMCVRYQIDICEKVSIALWILGLGVLSTLRLLRVVLRIIPLMFAMMIIGGLTLHPCCAIRRGWSKNTYFKFPSYCFLWEYIIGMRRFQELYNKVWAWRNLGFWCWVRFLVCIVWLDVVLLGIHSEGGSMCMRGAMKGWCCMVFSFCISVRWWTLCHEVGKECVE